MCSKSGLNLLNLKSNELKVFIESFDTVLTDCDGVLWDLDTVIDGSPAALNKFRKLAKQIFYVTNNNLKPREYYAQKAQKFEFIAKEDEILSTAFLTAEYLKSIKFDKKAYVIGSDGLAVELDRVGIKHIGIGRDNFQEYSSLVNMVPELDEDVEAVIVGFDPYFSYMKMLHAASYLNKPNCLFIGTNTDERFPRKDLNVVIPGTGSLVKAIEVCSDRKPIIIGKPNKYICETIVKKYKVNPARTLMIGDRCNTDILLGKKCGFQTLLVLSGVTNLKYLEQLIESQNEADKIFIPDFVIPKLGDLLPILEKYKND